MIGVYMYLYNLIICHQNNRVTDRHEEFLEFMLCLLRHWLIQKNNELCAVTEFNILLCLCIDFGHCRTLGTTELCIIHFFAQITVISSVENFYQSLSARVNNSCFFENRKHLRCSGKSLLCMSDHCLEKSIQILCSLSKLHSLGCSFLCHCKDSSLFRLHYCFVGSFHAFLHSCCNGCRIQIFTFLYTFGEATEKL